MALAIATTTLAIGAAAFSNLNGRAEDVEAAAVAADRVANAERLVRALVVNAETGNDSTWLAGDSIGVRFQSWCHAPAGALHRCSVHLFFRPRDSLRDLVVEMRHNRSDPNAYSTTQLWSGIGTGKVVYLVDGSYGGAWRDAWSGPKLPYAIGSVLMTDTLILPVGVLAW